MPVSDSSSVEVLDEVSHVLTCFVEVAEGAKTSFVVRLERTYVGHRGRQADDADTVGAELLKELAQGCRANTSAEDVGLSDQNIHINQVTGEVIEASRREFLPRERLPANEPNGPSTDCDQRLHVSRMLLDSGERVCRIAPPASDVGATQPFGENRLVAAGVKRGETDITHVHRHPSRVATPPRTLPFRQRPITLLANR